jgi:hypothetical protein
MSALRASLAIVARESLPAWFVILPLRVSLSDEVRGERARGLCGSSGQAARQEKKVKFESVYDSIASDLLNLFPGPLVAGLECGVGDDQRPALERSSLSVL